MKKQRRSTFSVFERILKYLLGDCADRASSYASSALYTSSFVNAGFSAFNRNC